MFYFGNISIILSTHVLVWEYKYYTKHTCFSFGNISIIHNTHVLLWEHKYYTKHTCFSLGTQELY